MTNDIFDKNSIESVQETGQENGEAMGENTYDFMQRQTNEIVTGIRAPLQVLIATGVSPRDPSLQQLQMGASWFAVSWPGGTRARLGWAILTRSRSGCVRA